jgi:hypothetical protein
MSLKKLSSKHKLADTYLAPVTATAQQEGSITEPSSNLKGGTELGAAPGLTDWPIIQVFHSG